MSLLSGSFWSSAALAALILCLLFLAVRYSRRGVRILLQIGLNCVVGMVVLTLLNAVSFWTGLALPVNAASLTASGLLGVPGVLALAAIKILV